MKQAHSDRWLVWCVLLTALCLSCGSPAEKDPSDDTEPDAGFDLWDSPPDSRTDVIVEELPHIWLEPAPDKETLVQLSSLRLRNAAGEEVGPVWLRTRVSEVGGRGLTRDTSVPWSAVTNIYTGVTAGRDDNGWLVYREDPGNSIAVSPPPGLFPLPADPLPTREQDVAQRLVW